MLIATDVASRGLDIKDITSVLLLLCSDTVLLVFFEVPNLILCSQG